MNTDGPNCAGNFWHKTENSRAFALDLFTNYIQQIILYYYPSTFTTPVGLLPIVLILSLFSIFILNVENSEYTKTINVINKIITQKRSYNNYIQYLVSILYHIEIQILLFEMIQFPLE